MFRNFRSIGGSLSRRPKLISVILPISSGLVLHYDPSNPLSYPGSGTTINNLANLSHTGTMSNITASANYFTYNGTSSQISIPDDSALEPGSGDFTLEVWIYYSAFAGSSRVIVGKTNGGLAADWGYGIRTASNGNTYLEVGNGTTSTTSPAYTVATGQWYQIVGVWTNVASNSIAFYANGALVGSDSHSFTSVKNTTRPLYFGSFDGGAVFGQWFNGQIGIVRIYNTSLSSAEVLQNYNANKAKYGLL